MTTQQKIDAINATAYAISVMMEIEEGDLLIAQKKLNELIESVNVLEMDFEINQN